ncbi:MAG TPA: helix-turn-helix domain-containing protein [Ktedonobacteraceae bacterium]|nr:helix-turn-helix domain-containing protein [Ktedonobacteraceae bacterium]
MSKNASTLSDLQEEHNEAAGDDTLLTVGEVARRLRVDTTTVRRWIVSGSLAAVVLPHHGKRQGYRIRQSIIDNILQTPSSH